MLGLQDELTDKIFKLEQLSTRVNELENLICNFMKSPSSDANDASEDEDLT